MPIKASYFIFASFVAHQNELNDIVNPKNEDEKYKVEENNTFIVWLVSTTLMFCVPDKDFATKEIRCYMAHYQFLLNMKIFKVHLVQL
jgi:hypothetical protein